MNVTGYSVALWEPDITPPDDWLISGILYQERISTFAPWPDVDNRDGREAARLRALLGDLYLPLSLGEALNPPGRDDLLDELRARLRAWHEWARRTSSRTGDPLVRRWLERSIDWPHRVRRLRELSDRILLEEQQARGAVDRRVAELDHTSGDLVNVFQQAEELRERVGPTLRRERDGRRAARADLLNERERLIVAREGWGRNQETDAAVRRVDAALKEVATGPKSPEQVELKQARDRLAKAQAYEREASAALARAKSHLADVVARRRRNQDTQRAPWEGDVDIDRWLSPRRLKAHIPLGFDTIAAGKVHSQIFNFLATEGGMWVSQDPRALYAGTLVGPGRIVRDVLRIIALWHCNQHDNWVPMSGGPTATLGDYEPLRASELVTIGVRALLPIPVDAHIEDALAFRLRHEPELAAVRLAIAADLPALESTGELADVIRLMQIKLAEPLAEIERALVLNASLRRGHVMQTALHRASRGTRNALAGLAAAEIAVPVLGNTATVAAVEATVGGGIVLTATAVSAQLLRAAFEQRRQPRHGPYQYIYDVGRQFPF